MPPLGAGLSDLLSFTPVKGHNIVLAAPKDDAAFQLGQQSMQLVSALQSAFDYVVIHAPSPHESYLGVDLSSAVDATVLVVRAAHTRKPVMLTIKDQIIDAGGKIVGLAITYRRSYIPAMLYRFL
jgi:Mrp family chromosome partitioning ATPase